MENRSATFIHKAESRVYLCFSQKACVQSDCIIDFQCWKHLRRRYLKAVKIGVKNQENIRYTN
jgi:hypothetical protein